MNKIILGSILLIITIGASAAPEKGLVEFFKDKTVIENPLDLRDPFKAPQSKNDDKTGKRKGYFVGGKGQYSNIAENQLGSLVIHDIKVVGVLIGKERRVLIHANETAKDVIILKEGMKIGPDHAELKAIMPGGIILVEKIVNVYGQEEYLETVIPISR
jgi:hypothetical protein